MEDIREDSSVPLYIKVKQYILRGIGMGKWPTGTRIPSENELVAQFGISRMTAHRALRELTAEGVLVRVHGLGTFTAKSSKAKSSLLRTQDISKEIELRGGRHFSEVLILERKEAAGEVSSQLELESGAEVFHSLIVHYENDLPLQLEERWINPVIAPNYLQEDFTKTTTHRHLLECAAISEIEHVIHAILPDEQEAELLKLRQAEPCLLLLRRTWAGGIVATYNRFIYPASRCALGGRFKMNAPEFSSDGHLAAAISPSFD